MKLIFIQTYPVYNYSDDINEWLALDNRDKWMPAIARQLGNEVELWVGARESGRFEYRDPKNELPPLPIRAFKTVENDSRYKKHYSDEMIEAAREEPIYTHFILKGTDGGIGNRLIEKYLSPQYITYSMIIGGKYYTDHVPKAIKIFYETEYQRKKLLDPGKRLWRNLCYSFQLIHLPKSIDTELFRPDPDATKEWDLITIGRLIPNYKNYVAIGKLSEKYKTSIIGDGPARKELQRQFPNMDFAGYVPNHQIPEYLNRARSFFYTGKRDFHPRVITEAMACGLPVIAFQKTIATDVVPENCGFLIKEQDMKKQVEAILSKPKILADYGKNAREHVGKFRHRYSSKEPLIEAFQFNT